MLNRKDEVGCAGSRKITRSSRKVLNRRGARKRIAVNIGLNRGEGSGLGRKLQGMSEAHVVRNPRDGNKGRGALFEHVGI